MAPQPANSARGPYSPRAPRATPAVTNSTMIRAGVSLVKSMSSWPITQISPPTQNALRYSMGSILSPGRGLLGFSVPRKKADMQRARRKPRWALAGGQSDAEPGLLAPVRWFFFYAARGLVRQARPGDARQKLYSCAFF